MRQNSVLEEFAGLIFPTRDTEYAAIGALPPTNYTKVDVLKIRFRDKILDV
jgi:hypothetical protein